MKIRSKREARKGAWTSWYPETLISEGAPTDLTDQEILDLIRNWDGAAAINSVFCAQARVWQPSTYVYIADRPRVGTAKVGVSSNPAGRAADQGADLRWRKFLGSAAYLMEQIMHAVLAPWACRYGEEWYVLWPEDIVSLPQRLLGCELPSEEPDECEVWEWRRTLEWSRPLIESLLRWPVPEYVSATYMHHLDRPTPLLPKRAVSVDQAIAIARAKALARRRH